MAIPQTPTEGPPNPSACRGVLPKASSVEWPQEPFRSQFIDVLKGLEMARFTRRHPKLLPPLLKQFMELVAVSSGDCLVLPAAT